jgi:hypothetical protein
MSEPAAAARIRLDIAAARALGEAAMRGAGYDADDARIQTDHVLSIPACRSC